MNEYYVIRTKDFAPKFSHSNEWPMEFAISFVDRTVLLSSGKGHGLTGAMYRIDLDELSDQQDFINMMGLTWFTKLIAEKGWKNIDENVFCTELIKSGFEITKELK